MTTDFTGFLPAELIGHASKIWLWHQMVIGVWRNFVDMPDLHDGEVVKADIWDV